MAIHYNPTTVSDGLVLALDAANTRSYGGSGTTWTDVSYNGNNGTLTNGPLYKTVGFTEPFGGAGGVYFDGNGDTLTLDGSAGNAGTGDFTMEFWFKGSKMEFNYTRTLHITSSGATLYFQLIYGGTIIQFSNSDWQNGNWHHHAIVRTGSTVKWYIDGVLKGTGTDSRSTNSATNFLIGQGFFGYMNGYVSNFRFVTSALYTSNFTPPRSLLTAISGTSLLTCQKGSITDASSNNFAITVNGDARPVYGFPSFKFDGTDDEVSISSYQLSTTNSSAPYTLSAWINRTGSTTDGGIITQYVNGTSAVDRFGLRENQGGKLSWWKGGSDLAISPDVIPTNVWKYVVGVKRSDQSVSIYVDGIEVDTGTDTLDFENGTLRIGRFHTLAPFSGKISQVSIYNKALTASEVTQNYNALKGRFGL